MLTLEPAWAVNGYCRALVGEDSGHKSANARRERTAKGMTQEKLTELADLHHNFIGEVERGNMEMSLGSMLKIAKALNVRVRDLVREL